MNEYPYHVPDFPSIAPNCLDAFMRWFAANRAVLNTTVDIRPIDIIGFYQGAGVDINNPMYHRHESKRLPREKWECDFMEKAVDCLDELACIGWELDDTDDYARLRIKECEERSKELFG